MIAFGFGFFCGFGLALCIQYRAFVGPAIVAVKNEIVGIFR